MSAFLYMPYAASKSTDSVTRSNNFSITSVWKYTNTPIMSDVQVCHQRLSSAFDLLLLFSNPNPNPMCVCDSYVFIHGGARIHPTLVAVKRLHCQSCDQNFHRYCAGVALSEYKTYVPSGSSQFECFHCKEQQISHPLKMHWWHWWQT